MCTQDNIETDTIYGKILSYLLHWEFLNVAQGALRHVQTILFI